MTTLSKKILRISFWLLPSFVCIVFFAVLFVGSRVHSQSIYFQDETDHVAMGWMMVEFGKGLYTDLSTNHQPIPVLFGAMLAATIKYQTLFELIENIRFSMFLFSLVTSVLLSIRFGWRGAIASTLTYSVSWIYFGWYVLAESLVIPAAIFMLLFALEKLLPIKKASVKYPLLDASVYGFAAFWTVFSLLPMVPFVGLLTLWLLIKLSPRERIAMIVSGLLCTSLLAVIVQPTAWFEETVHNNWKYFLVDQPPMTIERAIQLLLYPVRGVITLNNTISRNLFILAIIGTASTALLYIRSLIHTKQLLTLIGLFVLITLANPRVTENPAAFWSGFHLYPYVALFFTLTAHISILALSKIKNHRLATTGISLILLVILYQNSSWVWEKKNKLEEYYIQYGTQESYASAMKMIADPGDTFFSGPNGHGYMNMISGLPIAGRQLFHLPWAYNSPKLRDEFHQLLKNNPPTFIYIEEEVSGYHGDVMKVIPQSYRVFWHNDSPTNVYILGTKADLLSAQDLQKLEEFKYRIASQAETKALLSGELPRE